MAHLIARGTRAVPRWYVAYVDVDGGQKTRLLKGVATKADATRLMRVIEVRITEGKPGMERDAPEPAAEPGAELVAPLMERWRDSLTNRSAANDRSRITKRLLPRFKGMTVAEAARVPTVMALLDEADGASTHTQRHLLSLLGRFYGWLIDRGLTEMNPVRMIRQGSRPKPPAKKDAPWLRDETKVAELMAKLPEPVNLMFYLGNRCGGLRMGEIAGLCLRDLDRLDEGLIVARKSYGGFLKEDKHLTGKSKLVPAADDAPEILGPWLARRRAAGAGPDDLLFPYVPAKPQNRRRAAAGTAGGVTWAGWRKEHLEKCWEVAAKAAGVKLGWYQSTRHTWISRSLEAGASLDEVSAAVGHSSPVVTRRWYDHFVRERFSPALRLPIAKEVGATEPKRPADPPEGDQGPTVHSRSKRGRRHPE
ncbi:MAG TPA: site-specific integrase [Polyangia bacterium]|jgi:integrase